MASEEMDRALTRVKNAIKKLSAKGGVKIASEVWDVNPEFPGHITMLRPAVVQPAKA